MWEQTSVILSDTCMGSGMRTLAALSPTGRASYVDEARHRQCTLHRRLLSQVKAAHIAPHLLALALHAEGCLPPAAGSRKDPSVAALTARRQLELKASRAARAVEGLVRELVALAAACPAHGNRQRRVAGSVQNRSKCRDHGVNTQDLD